jgi:putative spermidine/putrescine transport system permease protein
MKREPPKTLADYSAAVLSRADADRLFRRAVLDDDRRQLLPARSLRLLYAGFRLLQLCPLPVSLFFGKVLGFSLGAGGDWWRSCCVVIAFPFTYLLTKRPRKVQTIWLVCLLSVLSLSEVIIGFAWSTLFYTDRRHHQSVRVAIGLMTGAGGADCRASGAVLTGMVYQALPYTILVLYPALVRLDPTLLEAARTLGASPVRAFMNVVVPALRNTIVATLIMVFVFALGSYLLPQILGRPSHWTLSVLITDQAIYQSNMPFAAAMAVFLVLMSLALVGLTLLVGRRENAL